ncbi:hypothetical protein HGA64_01655, partial [Candidatus Falkowbacteria bacterium]|nr:hypothetical protein [Candidatus Falkowbacteria bacterium]
SCFQIGTRNKVIPLKQQAAPGTYVYPRYKLENVIKQKIFGTNIDIDH